MKNYVILIDNELIAKFLSFFYIYDYFINLND